MGHPVYNATIPNIYLAVVVTTVLSLLALRDTVVTVVITRYHENSSYTLLSSLWATWFLAACFFFFSFNNDQYNLNKGRHCTADKKTQRTANIAYQFDKRNGVDFPISHNAALIQGRIFNIDTRKCCIEKTRFFDSTSTKFSFVRRLVSCSVASVWTFLVAPRPNSKLNLSQYSMDLETWTRSRCQKYYIVRLGASQNFRLCSRKFSAWP